MASKIIKNLLKLYSLTPGETISQRLASHSVNPSLIATMLNSYMDALYSDPQQDRRVRYKDYDSMDSYSDIHRALDIYSAEVTQIDVDKKRAVWVVSPHKDITTILHKLFDRLDMENNIRSMARHLSKYGDMFTYVISKGEEGVDKIRIFHPSVVQKIVDPDDYATTIGYQCDRLEVVPMSGVVQNTTRESKMRPVFEPWEFVHFKLGSSNFESQYGHSMIEAARHTWKTLELLETAITIHRLHRSGTRWVYYVDVGTAAPDEAKDIVNAWRRGFKQKTYLKIADQRGDSNMEGTGPFSEFLSKYNPLSLLDDIFWPVRTGDTKSRVENLMSDTNISALADVDIFKSKLRTALGIAKAYFDGDISGWNANKALGQQDIQFAKMLEPLQRSMLSGLEKLCKIHLSLIGVDPFVEFDVRLANPSNLLVLQRFENMAAQQQIASTLMGMTGMFGLDPDLWAHYVLENVMEFDKEFIKTYKTRPAAPPMVDPLMTDIIGDGSNILSRDTAHVHDRDLHREDTRSLVSLLKSQGFNKKQVSQKLKKHISTVRKYWRENEEIEGLDYIKEDLDDFDGFLTEERG